MRNVVNIIIVVVMVALTTWYAWDQGYLYPRMKVEQHSITVCDVLVDRSTGKAYEPPRPFTVSWVPIDYHFEQRKPDTLFVDSLVYEETYYDYHTSIETGNLIDRGTSRPFVIAKFYTLGGFPWPALDEQPQRTI
ncbi:MAG: hypothetical protein WCV85_04220 [Patescibacteria group bacterium]|jgi:hypothetical protein